MKALMIAGLVVSLWPVGFLGWSFLGNDSQSSGATAESQPAEVQPDDSTSSAAEPVTPTVPKKARKRAPGASSADNPSSIVATGSDGKRYICFGSSYEFDELSARITGKNQELRRLKKKYAAYPPSSAQVDYYNGLLTSVNERVRAYNRKLRHECTPE
jgi:hypothetical protein